MSVVHDTMQHKLRLFYRKLKQGECHETSPADTGFLCDRCAVFVVAIKETPCNFLSVVYSLFYLESFFLSGDFHVRHPIVFLIINIIYIYIYIHTYTYTGCPRRNVKYFRRVFLMLNYTDITQNTYVQS